MSHLTIPDFSHARVLIAGDLMLDRFWHGNTTRISPEAPVPVVKINVSEDRPGGAGNVALNVADLGAQATVIGLTGKDDACARLEAIFKPKGVHCEFITVEGSDTITKLRVISRQQQLIRLDFEDGFIHADSNAIVNTTQAALNQADALILSDYGKGALNDPQPLIKLANQHKVPVLIDPKGTDFSRYHGATLITPNMSEFEAVVGPCPNNSILEAKGLTLLHELHLEALLITRSEKGMSLLRKNQPPVHLPTHAREVYDVTGAGDTVIATVATALATGCDYMHAIELANLAAGVAVGKLGTATVAPQELQAATLSLAPLDRGVVDKPTLLDLVAKARQSGERIVMTNGCFDILHAGHVEYLKKARELGDRLIVAVNSDHSVKQLKGPSRPVNHLEERMSVLAGLSSIDWVVPFHEETPEQLITEVLPDTLVKGGDYTADQIAGAQQVTRAGGNIAIIDLREGCSTTRIINRIKEGNA